MMLLRFTRDTGVVEHINPLCIGVWYEVPQALPQSSDPGIAIEVNGQVRIYKDAFKKADKLIREALAPE